MKGTLQAYLAKLADLLQFIHGAESVDLLTSAAGGHGLLDRKGAPLEPSIANLVNGSANRKRFVYSAVVVSLYGYFESYAEELVMSFLDELNAICPSLSDFPQVVRERHIDVSAQLLLNRRLDKYRDRLSVDEIVRRLGHSADGVGVARINTLAFTDHRSNFRADSLSEFFKSAGISHIVQSMQQDSEFCTFMSAHAGLDRLAALPDSLILKDLDDLAQRRNEVAHGAPSNIWSVPLMLSRVAFMEQIGKGLYKAAHSALLPYLVEHRCIPLPDPIVVHAGKIVCLELLEGSISEGMTIVAKSPDSLLLDSVIESIEVNHRRVREVTAPPSVKIGLQVSFHAKNNQKFFLLT